MDIYSFIPSRDIAEHCRTIEHKFTPLEMAFIVYLSDKTLTERQKAWQWIIDTQPDMAVEERIWTPHYDSLHQFLRDYMALENQVIDLFKADEPNAVYTYKNCYAAAFIGTNTLFPTLDDVLTAIKKENEDGDIEKCRVLKRRIGEEYKEISMIIKPDGEFIDIWRSYIEKNDDTNEDDKLSLHGCGFEGMWIEIPTPFKKGDIVVDTCYPDNDPFVLTGIPYWISKRRTKEWLDERKKKWDKSDMNPWGYGITDNGRICDVDEGRYDRLEYYDGELTDKDRTLLALSNYIKEKKEISEDLLLNAYGVILRDEYICGKMDLVSEHDLEKAGLSEPHADNSEPPAIIEEHTDIYNYIPSRDIAAHCRKLKHTFSPLEQAVIIYHSNKTLAERHKAWQEIIDTQPDMEVVDWSDSKYKETLHESLHQFLKDYMRIENNLMDRLKRKEPNTIYTYAVQYTYKNPSDYDGGFYTYDTPYSTFESVIKTVKKDSEIDYSYKKRDIKSKIYYVYKRWLDELNHLYVQVTPDGDIISDWDSGDYVLEEDADDILSDFEGIDIYIPVPFRKGDILTYADNRPFVLTSDEWKYGEKHCSEEKQYLAEGHIMDSVYSYSIRENGHIFGDFNAATLDIEYYRGELTGLNRVLKAISSHMKGELPVDLMMNAYDIILHEEQRKSLRDDMWYTDEAFALVGLEKEKDENKLII